MSRAFLDGKPLTGRAAWVLRYGTTPATAQLDIAPDDADAILKKGPAPIALELEGAKWSNLYALQRLPHGVPALTTIEVADRRWFWSFVHVKAAYNIRRTFGVKRLTDVNAAPNEIQQVAPKIDYTKFSLRNGENVWKASEILRDVFEHIAQKERDTSGVSPTLLIDGSFDEIPVQDLFVDTDGSAALQQILSYLPGAALYINADGDAVVANRASGKETQVVNGLGPQKVGTGNFEAVDLSNLRPREIWVHFPREIELRLDNDEEATTVTDDDNSVTNVLQVPDYAITVNGVTYPQGSWVTFAQAFTGWGSHPTIGRALRFADLQLCGVPFNDLATGLAVTGAAVPDADWPARVAACMEHYRRTFRVNPQWMGRIANLFPYRVATLDVASGARGAATVYSDFAYLTGVRGRVLQGAAGKDRTYITNVAAYPSVGVIDTSTRAAPAALEIVDADQGIVRFNFRTDIYGVQAAILPSQVELEGDNTLPGQNPAVPGPCGDWTKGKASGRPIMWDVLGRYDRKPKLTGNYKSSCILTAAVGIGGYQGQDTNARQFTTVKVKPSDVGSFPGVNSCRGPIMEVRIGSGLGAARIAWNDGRKADILAAFGIPANAAAPNLDNLTVNLSTSGPAGVNGASCNAIAKATAARIYRSLGDRVQGSASFDLAPGAAPAGWLQAVEHSVETSGEARTSAVLPANIPQMSLEAYLDASTRWIIMHGARAPA